MKVRPYWLCGVVFFLQASLSFGMGPSKPVFDPANLNAIRDAATQNVNMQLDAMPADLYQQLALAYFQPHDGHYGDGEVPTDVSQADLTSKLKSYRVEMVMEGVHQALRDQYPGHIGENILWAWNNVGGVFARIGIVACSMSEYIAFWGTNNAVQNGFSGDYSMEVWDIMMTGRMWSGEAESRTSNEITYVPDQTRISYLAPGHTRTYGLAPYTYMIDYGRGNIAASVVQGILQPAFANHDWHSAGVQLKECAKHILGLGR